MSAPAVNTFRNELNLVCHIPNPTPRFCHRCNSPVKKPEKAFITDDKTIYCSELCFKKSKEIDEKKVMTIIKQKRLSRKQKSDIDAILSPQQIINLFKAISTPTSPQSAQ